MTVKTMITGFKQIQPVVTEEYMTCTLWSSKVQEKDGVIEVPFFRVLNSLPREALITIIPDGEKPLPAYENATIVFDRTHVPGQWLYFEQPTDSGKNNEIAKGFVEWLKKQKKIAVIIHAYNDNTESDTRDTVYWDTTGIELTHL